MYMCTVFKERKMREKKIPHHLNPLCGSALPALPALPAPPREAPPPLSDLARNLIQNSPPITYPIRNMPNKNSTWKFEHSLRKNFSPTPPSFANIKKNPSRAGEIQALSHRRKRGKIEKCWTKKSTCRSPHADHWPPPLIVTQSYQQSVLEDLSKVSKELIVDNSAA
jgi:hypothetical protein